MKHFDVTNSGGPAVNEEVENIGSIPKVEGFMQRW